MHKLHSRRLKYLARDPDRGQVAWPAWPGPEPTPMKAKFNFYFYFSLNKMYLKYTQ